MYYINNKKKKKESEQKKWIDKLDRLMSLYVRMRDSQEYHFRFFRCISCGRILPFEQADCGHFLSRRHMSLRFDTRNINSECKACNRFSSDHLIGYRNNLVLRLGKMDYQKKYPNKQLDIAEIKRLGEQQIALLETQAYQPKKWSVFELQELYKYYAALILKMKEEV